MNSKKTMMVVRNGLVVEVEVDPRLGGWHQAAWAGKLLGGFIIGCGACLVAGAELARWALS